MACSAVRSPLLRNPVVRHYAAAAAAPQCSAAANPEFQLLGNKVSVAALDTNSPIAQVSITFRAGPRNETYDTQGISHHLRIATGLSTQRATTFGITRNIQQLGGSLSAVCDRESISYTLRVTQDNLGKALTFLEDVATKQVFKPWEISDQIPRMRFELSTLPETTQVMELVHKAAYRRGLGYSLYSRKRQLGKISVETLQHFVNTWFKDSRCAVVATSVPLSEVSSFAQNLQISSGDAPNIEPAKYYGGDMRKERNSYLASVAVAVEGTGLNKEKDALAFAVLQRAAGMGPHVKWGTSQTPLNKAVASAAGSDPYAISAFNVSYSDSGLFGFVLCAPSSIAGTLVRSGVKWLRSPNVSEADIKRGKAVLKASVLYTTENQALMLENLAQQSLLRGRVASPQAIAAEIDKISASDVKSVASKLSSGKLSVGAIGDLNGLPYSDEI